MYVYAGIASYKAIGSMDPPSLMYCVRSRNMGGRLYSTHPSGYKILTLSTLFLEIGGPFLFFSVETIS